MSVTKFETLGGQVTRGETYVRIMDLLRELQDQCYVMAHLHATEDGAKDQLLATGWRGCGEMFKLVQHKVTALAQNKIEVMRR